MLTLAISNPVAASQAFSHSDSSRAFNYVVVIVLENHSLGDVINSSSAPFLNQLASTYGLAVNYTAIEHPSLPNYLALISGQNFSSWSASDCSPGPGCNAGAAPNIVDRLESRGLTWKAYMEDYPTSCEPQCSPGGCFLGDTGSGQYAARHDPFVYFGDIANSSNRCANIVPANSGGKGGPDDLFLTDLGSRSTASNFMWLTPNLCDDMHDCTVSTGDAYLSKLVPQILSSNLFTHQKAALFITFDEGNGDFPSDQVYSVWAGPVVKTSFKSSQPFSHYSFLSTLEIVWHIQPPTSFDAKALPMTAFFKVHRDHHDRESDDKTLDSRDHHSGSKNEGHSESDR